MTLDDTIVVGTDRDKGRTVAEHDGFLVTVETPPTGFEGNVRILMQSEDDATDVDLTLAQYDTLTQALRSHERHVRPEAPRGWLHNVTFGDGPDDGEKAGAVMIAQRPILFNGVWADIRFRRDLPLYVQSNGGVGRSEMLVSFVVHRDDVTWPIDEGRMHGLWSVGGYECYVPPLTSGPVWSWHQDDEPVKPHRNMSYYPETHEPTDRWVRVWLMTTPVFDRSEA